MTSNDSSGQEALLRVAYETANRLVVAAQQRDMDILNRLQEIGDNLIGALQLIQQQAAAPPPAPPPPPAAGALNPAAQTAGDRFIELSRALSGPAPAPPVAAAAPAPVRMADLVGLVHEHVTKTGSSFDDLFDLITRTLTAPPSKSQRRR